MVTPLFAHDSSKPEAQIQSAKFSLHCNLEDLVGVHIPDEHGACLHMPLLAE